MQEVRDINAGFVRLPHGRLMSKAAWLETRAEFYPEPDIRPPLFPPLTLELEDLSDAIERLRGDVRDINRRMRPAEALQRAKSDSASGALVSDKPKPKIQTSAAEASLWN